MSAADLTGSERRRPLPRGPHGLTREHVQSSQRTRLLDAMAEVVARKGYPAVTVGDVVGGARVSRKTFYEHFSGKEECFLAAYDAGAELLLERLEAAEAGHQDWAGRMRAGVRAYLRTLAERPAFARTFLLEITAAGARALDRRAEVHRRFASRLVRLQCEARAERPELPPLPDPVALALVGGVAELVSERVRLGRTAELPELEPALLHLHAAVLGGARPAASFPRAA